MPQIPLPSQNRTYSLSIDCVTMADMLDRDRTYTNSFRNLLAFSPTVRTELAREGSNTPKTKIASLLEDSQSGTKRSHANSVKTAIRDCHTFNTGPSKGPLLPWGRSHEEHVRILCPSTMWNEMCCPSHFCDVLTTGLARRVTVT